MVPGPPPESEQKFPVVVIGSEPPDWRMKDAELILIPPHQGMSLAALRAAGIAKAKRPFVGVLNCRYRPSENWLEQASSATADVTGGCIAPCRNLSWVGWAIYLMEYSHLAPPMRSGPVFGNNALLTSGGNVIYRTRNFPLGIMRLAEWELDFHKALLDEGFLFARNADLIAEFCDHEGFLSYCRERFALSRSIARSASTGNRYFFLISRFVLPAVVLGRVIRNAQRRRCYVSRLLWTFPLMLVLALVQGTGEMFGALAAGTGTRTQK